MIANLVSSISDFGMVVSISLRLLTMISIVAIGVLLVKYMIDGTICNRLFNALSIITIVLLVVDLYFGITGIVFAPTTTAENLLLNKQLALVILNNLFRITMVFLCTFFAYDSATMRLKKKELLNK